MSTPLGLSPMAKPAASGRASLMTSVVAMFLAVTAIAMSFAVPGPQGQGGQNGTHCWDLNENGMRDVATEDRNGDTVVDVVDCSATQNPGTVPAVTFSLDNPAQGVWTVTVQVSRAESLGSFQVTLVNRTTGSAVACGNQEDLSDSLSIACTQGTAPVTLTFSDLASNMADQLNSGDEFALSGVAAAAPYSIILIWKASGAIVRSGDRP